MNTKSLGILSAVRERFVDRLFVRGTILEVERVTPRMRRVRIHASDLAELSYRPGQHVRVMLGDLFTLRAYTIWQHDRDAGVIDLCVLDHPGQGPGAQWAATAKEGDAVTFRPPEGKFVVHDHSGVHLFIGDETASVAFGAMARVLPTHASLVTIVETESEHERLPLREGGDAHWVDRGTRPTGDPARLLASIRGVVARLPERAPRTAYLAGEAKASKGVRRALFDEFGWSRSEVVLKPFWTPGAKGLE